MNRLSFSKDKAITTLIVAAILCLRHILSLSCPILAYLGIPCPACGMTRAWLSVFRLDFAAAFTYHPLFWTVPLLYICFLYDGRLFKHPRLNALLYLALGVAFGVCWFVRVF